MDLFTSAVGSVTLDLFKNSLEDMAPKDAMADLFDAYTQSTQDEVDNEEVSRSPSTSTSTSPRLLSSSTSCDRADTCSTSSVSSGGPGFASSSQYDPRSWSARTFSPLLRTVLKLTDVAYPAVKMDGRLVPPRRCPHHLLTPPSLSRSSVHTLPTATLISP